MVKVVIVGDAPSSKNVNANIAFVGAKCFNTVVSWIKHLSPDYYVCVNSDDDNNLSNIQSLAQDNFKIVALGNNAAGRLASKKINFFKMPHPSGLNRQLNDKDYIDKVLKDCYAYVRDKN